MLTNRRLLTHARHRRLRAGPRGGRLGPAVAHAAGQPRRAGRRRIAVAEPPRRPRVHARSATALPDLPVRLRVGTRLWLGERSALRAAGTVLAVHPTPQGQSAGYHQRRGPRDGYVVVVSGGTSHGVALTAPRPGPQCASAGRRSRLGGPRGGGPLPLAVPAALGRPGVVPRTAAHARVDAADPEGHHPAAGGRAARVRCPVHDRRTRRDHRLTPGCRPRASPGYVQVLAGLSPARHRLGRRDPRRSRRCGPGRVRGDHASRTTSAISHAVASQCAAVAATYQPSCRPLSCVP